VVERGSGKTEEGVRGDGLIGFLIVLRAGQLGADEAVEADSFFSGLDRENPVNFRRNPDDEFSAV